jgi:hypothetical protein
MFFISLHLSVINIIPYGNDFSLVSVVLQYCRHFFYDLYFT